MDIEIAKKLLGTFALTAGVVLIGVGMSGTHLYHKFNDASASNDGTAALAERVQDEFKMKHPGMTVIKTAPSKFSTTAWDCPETASVSQIVAVDKDSKADSYYACASPNRATQFVLNNNFGF